MHVVGKRKPWAVLGGVVLVFALGIGLGSRFTGSAGHAAEKETDSAAPRAFVRQGDRIVIPEGSALRSRLVVQQVSSLDGPHTLVVPAAVEADPARTVNILSSVTGRVVRLLVRLGDHVVKGQQLAVIESGDLAQAYADDEKGRDALQRAERTLERARGLEKAGAGAVKDLEQAESDVAQARAEYNRAEARLKQIGASPRAKGDSRLLTLTAPMSGSIISLNTAAGAFVNDVTATLMTVANLESVWVTANVPEGEVAHVSRGQLVQISFPAYPGQTFRGSVSFVSDLLEPDTRRNKVRIAFANPGGRFKPNMFANVTFSVPQRSSLSVPASALLMNNDSTVVLVEVAPWTFVKRKVVPGYEENGGSRIERGLDPGERIVVKGGVLLND